MLALEIDAPTDGVFEVFAGCFEVFDGFGVGHPLESAFGDMGEGFEELGFDAGVEEFEVSGTVVEGVLDGFAKEFFGEVHVAFERAESHFWFDHPEFGEVTAGGAVFRAEGGAKGVDVCKAEGEGFGFELAADGEERGAAEEVVFRVSLFDFVSFFAKFDAGGDLEHCTGAFGIAGGDDRGVDVVESAFIEKLVDGLGELVSNSEDGSEGVSSHSEVGDFAEELHGCAFLLEGVGERVGGSEDFEGGGSEFDGLTGGGRFDDDPFEADTGSSGDFFEIFFGENSGVDDDLEVFEC